MWYLTVHSHYCVPPYLITIIFVRWCASSFRACAIYLSIAISADHLMVPLLVADEERVLPLFRKVHFSAEPIIIALLYSHSVLLLNRCFVVALIMIRIYTAERNFYLRMRRLTTQHDLIAGDVAYTLEIVLFNTSYLSAPLWISHECWDIVLAFLIVVNPLFSLLYLFLFSYGQLLHEKYLFLVNSIVGVIFILLTLWQ